MGNKTEQQTLKNIVVFASGSGTNFQSIIDAVEAGAIKASIRGLITNRPGIGALDRAENFGIDSKVFSYSDFENLEAYQSALLRTLKEWKTDLIVLAGYLQKIPSPVIKSYHNKIINIHPALLPKYGGKGYYGLHVHQAVIDNKEDFSGCTIHYVTEEYDQGPIIEQVTVPVYPTDNAEILAARILEQEHKLLPEVIAKLLE